MNIRNNKNNNNSSWNSHTNGTTSLPKPCVKGFNFGNLLGKGTYGYVYRATKCRSNDVVAIKCVLLSSLSKNARNNIINEISILKNLKHEFIVHMLDFHWDKNFVYLIFEFCPGGELATLIHLKRSFPESIVQHFLQQLASAMKFLRDNYVSHMDLKPQNILITGSSFVNILNSLNSFHIWRNVVLKIADFGFAQYINNDECGHSIRGSPLYMAPEMLLSHEYDARVDLWSIGVILYQCLFGQTPFRCSTTEEIVKQFSGKRKFSISIPKNVLSQNCQDLLERLLQADPAVRISFENFFNHPFIDLEHIPSEKSFQKASDILHLAVLEDSNGNFSKAFYNYREALQYLLPLHKWGIPSKPFSQSKQDSLKQNIIKYMERAEKLQIKCGLAKMDKKVYSDFQKVYNLIDLARDMNKKNLLQNSLDNYEKALELAIPNLKVLNEKFRMDFFAEINEWMTEAENVKQKLEIDLKKNLLKTNSLKKSSSTAIEKNSQFVKSLSFRTDKAETVPEISELSLSNLNNRTKDESSINKSKLYNLFNEYNDESVKTSPETKCAIQ